jgi:hypothetical protein
MWKMKYSGPPLRNTYGGAREGTVRGKSQKKRRRGEEGRMGYCVSRLSTLRKEETQPVIVVVVVASVMLVLVKGHVVPAGPPTWS